jgi:hypothetical protein
MKHLKHIQIFEAFESKILGKTLGYIKDPNDKQKFLEQIKRLCKSIDYPLSEMSDEYFEYLPFKSAISRAAMTGDEPCEATSKSEFPDYEVKGAKCEGGKIKRMWGARTRDVVCPVCNGTGIKPKKSELKLLKFWFTAEGKYVATTLVDGVIRLGRGSRRGSKFSTKISDYTIGRAVGDLDTLTGGEMAVMTIHDDQVIAYIYKARNGRYYAIQDEKSGSSPDDDSWKSHGRYSWALGRGEYENMRLLTPIAKKSVEEEEADPYTWNVGVSFNYGTISASTSTDVKSTIKDAHFAIVFDFGKLRKSEFENTQDTRSEREEAKKGSKLDPDQSNEAIKKKNIERYVNLISQKLDISTDISNCNRLVARALGHKSALYIAYGTNIYSNLSTIIDYYIRFMKAENDKDKKSYAEDISDRANDLFRTGMRRTDVSNSVIKEIKTRLKENNREEKYLKVLELTQKLSETIYDSVKNYQINDIEDLEVVAQKISSIRNIIKSDRYGLSRYFNYFVDNISANRPDTSYRYLTDPYYINIDEVLENLPRVIAIISKI